MATMTRSVDDSKLLNLCGGPMIIVSASGMLTGGGVLHRVHAYGPDPRNAVVLSGYQAAGTRGAALADGAKYLRIYGEDVPIRAEVVHMDEFRLQAPRITYITHGEPDASDALRIRIKRELDWSAQVPEYLERVSLQHPAYADAHPCRIRAPSALGSSPVRDPPKHCRYREYSIPAGKPCPGAATSLLTDG